MSYTVLVQILALFLTDAAILLLVAAALRDIATRTISNALVLAIAGIGLVLQLLAGSASASLITGAAVLVFGMFCWRRGYLGGGDAKLLTAASLIVSADQVVPLILATAIAGGILGLAYLGLKRFAARLRPTTKPAPRWLPARILRIELWRLRRHPTLPYATAIAAGTLFVLWRG